MLSPHAWRGGQHGAKTQLPAASLNLSDIRVPAPAWPSRYRKGPAGRYHHSSSWDTGRWFSLRTTGSWLICQNWRSGDISGVQYMEQSTSSPLATPSEMESEKTWNIPRTATLQSHPHAQGLTHSCSQAESPSESWGRGLSKKPNCHDLPSGLALRWSKYNLSMMLPQFVLCLPLSKLLPSLNFFSCLILWWQANRIIPTF